ncbi:MAG: 5-(carboxyamino)imidazole ribonucleotide synthase, partial [Gammaproteobacteria bacterium]|nr:5-(carboxyamino)imidazole ribonucleotide synthase [Gammaproteobacteria bacterium]
NYIAATCAAVTTEFENIPADTLDYLAGHIPVRPNAAAVRICQNRRLEKRFLLTHDIPHATSLNITCEQDILLSPTSIYPGIIKLASSGYDGKGQQIVENKSEALAAFSQFNSQPCVLEKKLELDYEISVVLARDEAGNIAFFPVAQNLHKHGILDVSVMPAPALPDDLKTEAERITGLIAGKMDYIGTMAVEFFIAGGQLLVNEIAPRPHNSGHATIDACYSSQFEQQVRALCGLPLGDSRAHSSGIMVNLLGDHWYPDSDDQVKTPDWPALLSIPSLKLHLYGKEEPRPGRKMGHFTILAGQSTDWAEIVATARQKLSA